MNTTDAPRPALRRSASHHLRRFAAVASLSAMGFGIAAGPASAADVVSQATAQAVNINLLNGTAAVAASATPTSAVYSGSGGNVVAKNSPALSLLSGETAITAGALEEYAEADTNGTSFGCAGIVAPGGGIQVGTGGTSCSATGSGTGALTIDLGQLTGGLGTLLNSIADVQLHLDAVTAFARLDASGDLTRSASVTGGSLTIGNSVIDLANGGSPVSIPLNISSAPNTNLLTTITQAISGYTGTLAGILNPLATSLSNALAPVLSIVTNYQPAPNAQGDPYVSAVHISLLNTTGAVADLAGVNVGPNAAVSPAPAFPVKGLPITAGGLGLAALIIVPWYRRRRRAASIAE